MPPRCDAVAVTVPVHPGDDLGMPVQDGDQLVARVPRLVPVARVGREVGQHVRRMVAEHDDVRAQGRAESRRSSQCSWPDPRDPSAPPAWLVVSSRRRGCAPTTSACRRGGSRRRSRPVPVTGGTRTGELGLAQRLDVLRPGERRAVAGRLIRLWSRRVRRSPPSAARPRRLRDRAGPVAASSRKVGWRAGAPRRSRPRTPCGSRRTTRRSRPGAPASRGPRRRGCPWSTATAR